MRATIVGGGVAGLSLALCLHEHGIECEIYEAATALKEIGVGITILPNAMRELSRLGLQEQLVRAGIVNETSAFFNRYGQLYIKSREDASQNISTHRWGSIARDYMAHSRQPYSSAWEQNDSTWVIDAQGLSRIIRRDAAMSAWQQR